MIIALFLFKSNGTNSLTKNHASLTSSNLASNKTNFLIFFDIQIRV